MTRDDIIRMGRKAGALIEIAQEKDLLWLERFAALVAEREREACAKALTPVKPVAYLVEYLNGEKEVRFQPNGWGDKVTPLYTAPQPQPCNPAEDGVCEALECCKDQPKALRLAEQILQRDYELSLREVVNELRTLYYEREGYRESADKNAALFAAMVEQADRDTALLRQALEALEVFERAGLSKLETVDAIKALRERLK